MWAFHCGNCSLRPRESAADEATKALLSERQREYKMAALRAKKQGDVEQARLYLRTSKVSKETTTHGEICLKQRRRAVCRNLYQQSCVLYKFECFLCCVPAFLLCE